MAKTFSEIVQAAWERRQGLRSRVNAFRLLNGAASGTPGLVVDMFSAYLVVYAYADEVSKRKEELSACLREVTGAKAACLKDRAVPDESGRQGGMDLFGEVPETAEVSEGSLRFLVHLRHPRNVGLFLDTRELRQTLLSTCGGKEMLNLFGYSCSLGAAAALGGAAFVVNVDISSRYLGWGKANFELNGIASGKSKFVRMDSEAYLDWAGRKSLGFDAIVLDPPSFSRADGKTFAFSRDYFRLLGKAARLLKPGGRVFALTNFGGIAAGAFKAGVEEALALEGKPSIAMGTIPLPEDFDPGEDGTIRHAVIEASALSPAENTLREGPFPKREGSFTKREGAFLAVVAQVA